MWPGNAMVRFPSTYGAFRQRGEGCLWRMIGRNPIYVYRFGDLVSTLYKMCDRLDYVTELYCIYQTYTCLLDQKESHI